MSEYSRERAMAKVIEAAKILLANLEDAEQNVNDDDVEFSDVAALREAIEYYETGETRKKK